MSSKTNLPHNIAKEQKKDKSTWGERIKDHIANLDLRTVDGLICEENISWLHRSMIIDKLSGGKRGEASYDGAMEFRSGRH